MRYQAALHSANHFILAMTSEITARENLCALCGASQTTSSFANRLQVAMVEVANFGAICKTHSIAKPVKAISQNDLAHRANGPSINFGGEGDRVAHLQVDLALMGRCECMGFPRGCHE